MDSRGGPGKIVECAKEDETIVLSGKISGASEHGSENRRIQKLTIQLNDSYWPHIEFKGLKVDLVFRKDRFPFKITDGEEYKKKKNISSNAFPYRFKLERIEMPKSRFR